MLRTFHYDILVYHRCRALCTSWNASALMISFDPVGPMGSYSSTHFMDGENESKFDYSSDLSSGKDEIGVQVSWIRYLFYQKHGSLLKNVHLLLNRQSLHVIQNSQATTRRTVKPKSLP